VTPATRYDLYSAIIVATSGDTVPRGWYRRSALPIINTLFRQPYDRQPAAGAIAWRPFLPYLPSACGNQYDLAYEKQVGALKREWK